MTASMISNVRDTKVKTISGDTALRVIVEDQPISVSGNLLEGISFDAITTSFPNATTEIYFYRTGGLAGAILATITVIYVDSTKKLIDTVERT